MNRIVPGVAITHLLSDPERPEDEVDLRYRIVRTAIDALSQDVDGPTVFGWGAQAKPVAVPA